MQNIALKQFNDTVEYQKYRKHKKMDAQNQVSK